MKIHQLPLDARFEYEGEQYVKTGPMSATSRKGQRFIPRYAVLKPLEDQPPAPPPRRESFSRATVLAALEQFESEFRSRLPADYHADLDRARDAFLKALDGP